MATVSADTTAITPPPSLHGGAPSIASTDIPLTRTVSRAETISSSMSSGTSFKLDPNRPKFKVKPREKKAVGSIGGPTESVAGFKRDEYFGQRPLYVAAFMAGYFVGSPDLAMNVVKGLEKGVVKVTGLSSDPIGAKRERKRKAALAKLSAMETYGVTPPPGAVQEETQEEEDDEDENDRRSVAPRKP